MKYVKEQLQTRLTAALAQTQQKVFILAAQGGAGMSALESSMSLTTGVPVFTPTSSFKVLGEATVLRTLSVSETGSLMLDSENVDVSITVAGTVSHVVIGATLPLALDSTDITFLRGKDVAIGDVVSVPRANIKLEGI